MKPLCVVSWPIDTFSGYGARSRDFVKSLIQLKDKEWDIKILPQRWGECPWNFLSQDDPLRQRFILNLQQQPDIWIQITVPNEFQAVGQFNIGVSAGIETTIYPAEFIEGSNRMNLNLVSSEHSKKVALSTQFEKKDKNTNQTIGTVKIEKPVEVLFEGLDLDKYYKKPTSSKTNILKDIKEDFCFLYTGHWLQGSFGEDRKNTGLMIKTFLETFNNPGRKKPALVLKANHVNYSLLDREQILKKINDIRDQVSGNLPNIYLLHGEMTDEEMNLLNNDPKVKAFVSFTKGEGYGRPLAEAAITGKPVITSNWSGHTDFLPEDKSLMLPGSLTNVPPEAFPENIYVEGSQWFSVNYPVASNVVKDVYNNYKKYVPNAKKLTFENKNKFSLNAMTKEFEKILDKHLPEFQEQVSLKLPQLKSTGKTTSNIKLPKLKKK